MFWHGAVAGCRCTEGALAVGMAQILGLLIKPQQQQCPCDCSQLSDAAQQTRIWPPDAPVSLCRKRSGAATLTPSASRSSGGGCMWTPPTSIPGVAPARSSGSLPRCGNENALFRDCLVPWRSATQNAFGASSNPTISVRPSGFPVRQLPPRQGEPKASPRRQQPWRKTPAADTMECFFSFVNCVTIETAPVQLQ